MIHERYEQIERDIRNELRREYCFLSEGFGLVVLEAVAAIWCEGLLRWLDIGVGVMVACVTLQVFQRVLNLKAMLAKHRSLRILLP